MSQVLSIKLEFNGELRRLGRKSIADDGGRVSFGALRRVAQECFPETLGTTLLFKYVDEDQDEITISTDGKF